MSSVLLVGCGNMGYAMLAGWIGSGRLKPDQVNVVEPDEALRKRAARLDVSALDRVQAILGGASPKLIVFAVKPQIMADVIPAYKAFTDRGSAVLSVAAGTRIALFEKLLGPQVPVIRCMPNTPAAIGEGMMVTVINGKVDASLEALVHELLSASGKVASVEEEDLIDAVTAVSGSGPAYLFHFIECLAAAGKKIGLPDETAELLALQTVAGAARLAAESNETPARLREQVTSPNGTTAAALGVLRDSGKLEALVVQAVQAARDRSRELG